MVPTAIGLRPLRILERSDEFRDGDGVVGIPLGDGELGSLWTRKYTASPATPRPNGQPEEPPGESGRRHDGDGGPLWRFHQRRRR